MKRRPTLKRAFTEKEEREFTLANDPPAPPKGPPIFGNGGTQKSLFTGLDLPPETRELFDTTYQGDEQ